MYDVVALTFYHMGEHNKQDLRAAIQHMDDCMRAMATGKSEDCPVRHFFGPGTYSREITMPAGEIVAGRIHRHEHTNIITRGHCVVLTEDGFAEYKAGDVFTSKPGNKRLVYNIETTTWITVHENPDNCRDPETIVKRLSAESYEEIELEGSYEHVGIGIAGGGRSRDEPVLVKSGS